MCCCHEPVVACWLCPYLGWVARLHSPTSSSSGSPGVPSSSGIRGWRIPGAEVTMPAPPPLPPPRGSATPPSPPATAASGALSPNPTARRSTNPSPSLQQRSGGVRLHRVPSPLGRVPTGGESPSPAPAMMGVPRTPLERPPRSRSSSPQRPMDVILGAMGTMRARQSVARIGVAMAVGAGTVGSLGVGRGGVSSGSGRSVGLLRFRALEDRILLHHVSVQEESLLFFFASACSSMKLVCAFSPKGRRRTRPCG